jgi:hypothetical protein
MRTSVPGSVAEKGPDGQNKRSLKDEIFVIFVFAGALAHPALSRAAN